ncbi:MAG: primosomal replication protein N [Gammaproteobacteria bacterium]|nr:primosomal replication protein N [Gammaproteobacteria bacterium]
MLNQVVLSGLICKTPKFSESPAGVVHGQFSIEHKSIQQESEFSRNAYIRIHVVTCGQEQKQLVKNFIVGDAVQVSGFLNRHESNNGTPIIALHAQQIERLN